LVLQYKNIIIVNLHYIHYIHILGCAIHTLLTTKYTYENNIHVCVNVIFFYLFLKTITTIICCNDATCCYRSLVLFLITIGIDISCYCTAFAFYNENNCNIINYIHSASIFPLLCFIPFCLADFFFFGGAKIAMSLLRKSNQQNTKSH